MKYHDITHDDMKNGDGLRVVLWVSGCSHNCKNCHNPITHDPNSGLDFDDKAKVEIFDQLGKDYISGLTLSGGDPLYPDNRETVTALIKEVKEKFPQKNIWLYTGYTWEEIKDLPLIPYIDILVDGKYIENKSDRNIKWRGSKNQKVIDVQKTLSENRIVLHCD